MESAAGLPRMLRRKPAVHVTTTLPTADRPDKSRTRSFFAMGRKCERHDASARAARSSVGVGVSFGVVLAALTSVTLLMLISRASGYPQNAEVFRPRLIRLRKNLIKEPSGVNFMGHVPPSSLLSSSSSPTGRKASTRTKRTVTDPRLDGHRTRRSTSPDVVGGGDASTVHPPYSPSNSSSPRNESAEEAAGDAVSQSSSPSSSSSPDVVEMSFFALGKSFNFTLVRDDGLISPQFAVVKRRGNVSEILGNPLTGNGGVEGCLFTGRKFDARTGEQVASVAVSLCHGILGVIQDDTGDFVVRPLAGSPRRRYPHEATAYVGASPSETATPGGGGGARARGDDDELDEDGSSLEDHVIYRTNALSSDYYSSGAYSKPVEEGGWPSGSDTYADSGYDSAEPRLFSKRKTRRKRRIRAAPPLGTRLYMELAVFVDRFLLEHMKKNFPDDTDDQTITIVMAMMNAVHLLYNDESLGYPIDVVLKRLELLESDPMGLMWPFDIDRLLTEFCEWQEKENPEDDTNPLHWDHALLLTGLDLFTVEKDRGKINSEVVGLAPVGGMCTKTSSCTVNEGRHFETVYVVAHEIGHSLGMRHDGAPGGNNCDPGTFIMSPTLGSGKITWSPCSRRYLIDFLESSESDCLKDPSTPASGLDHAKGNILPGEKFNPDEQCVLKYGKEFVHSSEQDIRDICRDLHCQIGRVKYTSHPALEGSNCGNNRWCRRGRCESKTLVRKARDGGWGTWSSYSACKSECLYGLDGDLDSGSVGIRISARHCNSPYPEFGGRECFGMNKRYMTCDHHEECSGNGRRRTVEDYANRLCEEEARFDSELTGQGLQRDGFEDADRACAIWCRTKDGGFTNRGWTFPDGTKCRLNGGDGDGRAFCLGGRCQAFQCSISSMFLLDEQICRDEDALRLKVAAVSSSRQKDPGWGPWIPDENCNQDSCILGATALQVVSRDCLADDWKTCVGAARSRKICQPREKCRTWTGPHAYATNFCTRHRPVMSMLSGVGMQLPATLDDPDRPCRIACQDKDVEYRFYRANGEEGFFPAGTDCSDGRDTSATKRHYCVRGKCRDFGDDNVPIDVNSPEKPERPTPTSTMSTLTLGNDEVEIGSIAHDLGSDGKGRAVVEFESTKISRDSDRYRYEWNSSRSERDSGHGRWRDHPGDRSRDYRDDYYQKQERIWRGGRPTGNFYNADDAFYRKPGGGSSTADRYNNRYRYGDRRPLPVPTKSKEVTDDGGDRDRDRYSITSRWTTSANDYKRRGSPGRPPPSGGHSFRDPGRSREDDGYYGSGSHEGGRVSGEDDGRGQRTSDFRRQLEVPNSGSSRDKYYSSTRNKYSDEPEAEFYPSDISRGGTSVVVGGGVDGGDGVTRTDDGRPAVIRGDYRRAEQLETHRWRPKYRSDSSWPPPPADSAAPATAGTRGRYKFPDRSDPPRFRRRFSKPSEEDAAGPPGDPDPYSGSSREYRRPVSAIAGTTSSTRLTRRRGKRDAEYSVFARARMPPRSTSGGQGDEAKGGFGRTRKIEEASGDHRRRRRQVSENNTSEEKSGETRPTGRRRREASSERQGPLVESEEEDDVGAGQRRTSASSDSSPSTLGRPVPRRANLISSHQLHESQITSNLWREPVDLTNPMDVHPGWATTSDHAFSRKFRTSPSDGWTAIGGNNASSPAVVTVDHLYRHQLQRRNHDDVKRVPSSAYYHERNRFRDVVDVNRRQSYDDSSYLPSSTALSPYHRHHPDVVEGSFYEWQVVFSPCGGPACGPKGAGTRKVEVRCLSGGVLVHDVLCDDWRRPTYPSNIPCTCNDVGSAVGKRSITVEKRADSTSPSAVSDRGNIIILVSGGGDGLTAERRVRRRRHDGSATETDTGQVGQASTGGELRTTGYSDSERLSLVPEDASFREGALSSSSYNFNSGSRNEKRMQSTTVTAVDGDASTANGLAGRL